MLQHVAVCCSVLQCVAVCCSVLQCVAVCCSVLQCVAVRKQIAGVSEAWMMSVSVCVCVCMCVCVCVCVVCVPAQFLQDHQPQNHSTIPNYLWKGLLRISRENMCMREKQISQTNSSRLNFRVAVCYSQRVAVCCGVFCCSVLL